MTRGVLAAADASRAGRRGARDRRRRAARCRPTACATRRRLGAAGRSSSSSWRRADLALFPGPLLAGASGLLFGTALGTPVSIVAATLGAPRLRRVAPVGARRGRALAGPRLHVAARWSAGAVPRRALRADRARRAVRLVNYAAGLTPVRLRTFAPRRRSARAARVRLHRARRLARRPRLAGGASSRSCVLAASRRRPRAAPSRGSDVWICSRLVVPGRPSAARR